MSLYLTLHACHCPAILPTDNLGSTLTSFCHTPCPVAHLACVALNFGRCTPRSLPRPRPVRTSAAPVLGRSDLKCLCSRSNYPSRALAVAFVCVLSSVVGCAWGWLCLSCLEESRRIHPMPQHVWRTTMPRSRSNDPSRASAVAFVCVLSSVVGCMWGWLCLDCLGDSRRILTSHAPTRMVDGIASLAIA